MTPSLAGNYLAYSNSIRLDLVALPELNKKMEDQALTPYEIAEIEDKEQAEKKAIDKGKVKREVQD